MRQIQPPEISPISLTLSARSLGERHPVMCFSLRAFSSACPSSIGPSCSCSWATWCPGTRHQETGNVLQRPRNCPASPLKSVCLGVSPQTGNCPPTRASGGPARLPRPKHQPWGFQPAGRIMGNFSTVGFSQILQRQRQEKF